MDPVVKLVLISAMQEVVYLWQISTLNATRMIIQEANNCKTLEELVERLKATESALMPDVVPKV